MAARPQWNFASIGLTKSVHPYCRLAIIVMQMMPNSSCHQRPANAPCEPDADCEFMSPPPNRLVAAFLGRRLVRPKRQAYDGCALLIRSPAMLHCDCYFGASAISG